MTAITRAEGTGPSGVPTPPSVLDFLEVRPGWQVQVAAGDGLVHWPTSLTFDRSGNAWVVEKSESGGQLYRLSDTDHDGVYDRREPFAAPLQHLESVAAWSDWLYLIGSGRMVRWRSPMAAGQPEAETLLEGITRRPVYCSVSPAGLWLRCGGEIRLAGQPAGRFPKSDDLLLLIPHDSREVRLVGWSQAPCPEPVASDVAGNVWLGSQLHDRQPQLFRWQPFTETIEPVVESSATRVKSATATAEGEESPADFQPLFFVPAPQPLANGQSWPRPSKKPPGRHGNDASRWQSLVGLVCDYDADSEEDALPSLVWAKVWPAEVVSYTPRRENFAIGVRVRPAHRVAVLCTALATDRTGGIFLAGRYRLSGGEVRGFLLRIVRRGPNSDGVARTELCKLDNRQLLQQLASARAAELLAVQEEICRRGEAAVAALLELASSLAEAEKSGGRGADEGAKPAAGVSPLSARRALRLLTARRPAAARPLGWKLIRHSSTQLALAGIALLRGDRSDETRSALVQLLSERSLEVRRAAALALADSGDADTGGGREAAEVAATFGNFLRFCDERELAWLDALARGLERCGEVGLTVLWEIAHSGSQQELALAVLAWTRLYSLSALAQIGKWLDHPHLTHKQRQTLLQWWSQVARYYPVSARPILQWLQKQERLPHALLAAGLQALAAGTGEDGADIARFAARWLQHEDLTVRLAAIQCSMRHAIAPSARMTLLRLVQENARSPQERWLAAEALLAYGDEEIRPQVLALLADTSQGAALRERVAVLLLIYGDAHTRQQTLGRLADWPADMGQTVVLHLRPEKELLLELARNLQRGNLSTTDREMPWYLRLTRAAPAWLKDALIEALAVWAADDLAAWQVMAALAEGQPATTRE